MTQTSEMSRDGRSLPPAQAPVRNGDSRLWHSDRKVDARAEAAAQSPPDAAADGASRNAGFALVTQLTTAAFTAGLTMLLVRALGPRQCGIFALAVGVGALVNLRADYGI